MKALWLENLRLDLRDVPEPASPGEALILIRKAGICSTDLELVKGYYPFTGIIGHEFVGEVIIADDESWLGQRVVGDINVTCGNCEQCRNGRSTHCENRTVLGITKRDGAFAKYTTLPLSNLHRVPASVPDEMAVFTEIGILIYANTVVFNARYHIIVLHLFEKCLLFFFAHFSRSNISLLNRLYQIDLTF